LFGFAVSLLSGKKKAEFAPYVDALPIVFQQNAIKYVSGADKGRLAILQVPEFQLGTPNVEQVETEIWRLLLVFRRTRKSPEDRKSAYRRLAQIAIKRSKVGEHDRYLGVRWPSELRTILERAEHKWFCFRVSALPFVNIANLCL
jgi:hypothetical protein